MGRRDHFDDGHGNDDHKRYSISPEEVQYLLGVSNVSKELSDWRQQSARNPVNLGDLTDIKMHLIQSHDMSMDALDFVDETAHGHIPGIIKKLDTAGESLPQLSLEDLRQLHDHDHTEGEFASEMPHTTMDGDHFHH